MQRRVVATALALALVASLVLVSRALRSDRRMLLAWTSGHLPAGLAASARKLQGVESVAEVRNGTAWLSAWADDGGGSSAPPKGLRVPVEVAAVDPEQYAALLPRSGRDRFVELSHGEALLGRTGARLRGISGNGSLAFGDVRLSVRGVVDDALVASHEVVVSQRTGAALGITTPRYLLMALGTGTPHEDVEKELRDLLPSGTRLKVRPYGEAGVLRPGDPVLPNGRVKVLFGEFAGARGSDGEIRIDPEWILANTVTTSIPVVGRVRCHKRIVAQMRAAFEEIERRELAGRIRDGDFGGCFSPRRINDEPDSPLSHHAWGIGFDVNVSQNPYGQKPSLDRRVVEILERWGFIWGGRWLVPDGMHFEYLNKPVEDAAD
jgi:hypothetical protein